MNRLLIVIIYLFLSNCLPKEEFSNIPSISFDKIEYVKSSNNINQDSINLTISFTDGDGDLGLSNDDINFPYNPYDAIIDELGVIPLIGSTVIINNADLDIEKLFVIYDSLNTTYYYYPEDLKERFVIRPNAKAHIFGILKNGFIATFSMARFNAVKWVDFRNKNFSFMLDLDPVKPTKKKDLKK